MSWIKRLYDTYEKNTSQVGRVSLEGEPMLLPICHSTQQAQITITLNHLGEFLRATVVPLEDRRTIIPCTERSGSRGGTKPVNHPLCDKLQYVAGDFLDYGGVVTSGFSSNPTEPHEMYLSDLATWCESDYSHPKVTAVYKYVSKGTVIRDLVQHGTLHVDASGKLLDAWNGEADVPVPDIFQVLRTLQQQDVFIRWAVEVPGDPQTQLWTDNTVYESWIQFYTSSQANEGLCYVIGEETELALFHPAKLRNDGDSAKLISANDKAGFTFRGRFLNDGQAAGVSFEVTQKAHNALRWLIQKQAFQTSGLVILTWATGGEDVPDPLMDLYGLSHAMGESISAGLDVGYTAEDFARELRRSILGYQRKLEHADGVMIIILDAATPGRMSIRFYREMIPAEFISRIEHWHQSTAWTHTYRSRRWSKELAGTMPREYVSAPSPIDMADAIYGHRLDDNLRKTAIERLVRCIVDSEPIPRDMVQSVVYRAANPVAMERWEWNKALTIACSMYRKFRETEGYALALEVDRRSRDYLYGRLLALADSIEEWALSESGEQRQTNAIRLMQRFSERPFSTWKVIELSLAPYKARLGGRGRKRVNEISEVMALFETEDFISDKKLSGEFLLGYHCQKQALWKTAKIDGEQLGELND
ncbi:MAG: type I-C CRISPR-associated protein Cas8c/Csd1 [Firmicutes bacterium]|nr:type I-C CRISPR-associated protein Cas8c/Csd1 [Bacillota bacterium]